MWLCMKCPYSCTTSHLSVKLQHVCCSPHASHSKAVLPVCLTVRVKLLFTGALYMHGGASRCSHWACSGHCDHGLLPTSMVLQFESRCLLILVILCQIPECLQGCMISSYMQLQLTWAPSCLQKWFQAVNLGEPWCILILPGA